MSLAFNLFFWDEWLGLSSPDTGSGGGKSRKPPKRAKLYSDDFPQLDADFWDQRERYIRSLKELEPAPVIHDIEDTKTIQERIARLNEQRSALILRLSSAADLSSLKEMSGKVNALNSEITLLMGKIKVSNLKQ